MTGEPMTEAGRALLRMKDPDRQTITVSFQLARDIVQAIEREAATSREAGLSGLQKQRLAAEALLSREAGLDVERLAQAIFCAQHATALAAYDKFVPPNSANRAEHEERAFEVATLYARLISEKKA